MRGYWIGIDGKPRRERDGVIQVGWWVAGQGHPDWPDPDDTT